MASLWVIGLVLTFLLSCLFSIIKVIFNAVDKNAVATDDEGLRYYTSKIDDIQKNPALLSSTVAFGRTFANVSFATIAVMFSRQAFPHWPLTQLILISSGFSLFVLTALAYHIPRSFALRFFRSYLPVAYSLYKVFSWLFLPFASFFSGMQIAALKMLKYDEKLAFLSDDEKARITEGDDPESLDEEEKEMIRSIFDLGETTVDEIMVPRIDMKALELHSDLDTVLKMIREEGHSRIPVYKDTVDSITGILYSKDILSWLAENQLDSWDLPKLIKQPHFIPVGKKVNELMREFKRKHIHIAIIVDEYGGTAGLVTMEDILEEIVGDIQDEYDEEEKEIVKVADNVYLIDPHIDLHDLNEELQINLDVEDVEYNTLGGLIYHEYGDVPRENTEFEHGSLRITVVKMDNQRIEKVKIQVFQRPSSVEIDTF